MSLTKGACTYRLSVCLASCVVCMQACECCVRARVRFSVACMGAYMRVFVSACVCVSVARQHACVCTYQCCTPTCMRVLRACMCTFQCCMHVCVCACVRQCMCTCQCCTPACVRVYVSVLHAYMRACLACVSCVHACVRVG